MRQLDFFSTADTRDEARKRIGASAAAYREQVYRCIKWNGPVTDEQIAELTGISANTARPRRIELKATGRIRPGGYGTTKAGRRAVAWVAVPET